jgi:hypothetical protein
MGSAGQRIFTGVFYQSNIALMYALEALDDPTFLRIIIEEIKREDFGLYFSDRKTDYETKWCEKKVNHKVKQDNSIVDYLHASLTHLD